MPKIYIQDADGSIDGFDAQKSDPVKDYFEVLETVVSFSDGLASSHKTQLLDEDGTVIAEHNVTEGSARQVR